MTKTPRMYSPEYGDSYFFKFSNGTVCLKFISIIDGNYIFYNESKALSCVGA